MFDKIMKYLISIVIIIVIISIIGMVYAYTTRTKEEDVHMKINDEIGYFDRKLIELLKALNNLDTEYMIVKSVNNSSKNESAEGGNTESSNQGSESTEGGGVQSNNTINVTTKEEESVLLRNRDDINWNYIQTEVEKLINSWAVVTIDLKSINVNNEDILEFNTIADGALIYIKANDKANSLISLANLYSLLPRYKSASSDNTQDVELLYTKSDILSSYALLYTEQWDEIYNLLADSDSRMSKLINSNEVNSNNKKNIQKAYILLKEYIKSTNNKDVDLCYMKFYYLMQEMEL